MTPATGDRVLRFVGDKVRFTLRDQNGSANRSRAFLRTNLGRAAARRREIIAAHAGDVAAAGLSWRDLPMTRNGDLWELEVPLAETGYFNAKAYFLDEKKWQYWPEGPDVGIAVHPDFARTANTIYCAFVRLFGETRILPFARDERLETQLKVLDDKNFTVIPPSGTLRDLKQQLPHIVQTLGCRVLHLLPIHPTPTTGARFGRFGSPYAALDLTAVDPALVEFDKRTTGVDQFCELTYAAHSLGARVFLDIVINHTGWGSVLQENSPEFFLKHPDGEFASPGAWGVTWEDLVELKQDSVVLWDRIADALLTWCRRGTDGFRCDAGYKIPVPAWQYIVARVQDEFPETIFLLEGLGGSWEATEALLTDGGMQWAYSELFQNYSGRDVAWYLDYANRQSSTVGAYVHYSETHDNLRLAEKGRAWSLLRNRLCALASPNGGFGFTCGVEWLAAEKIRVHDRTGLNWDSGHNIVPELAQLNRLLAGHPCFFDGAKLTRLSLPDSPAYALLRESADGKDTVLVLVNTDIEKDNLLTLPNLELRTLNVELLGQPLPKISAGNNKLAVTLPAGAVYCLAPAAKPAGLAGDDYRRARAQAAFALQALNTILPVEQTPDMAWRDLAGLVDQSPAQFLAALSYLRTERENGKATDFKNSFSRVGSMQSFSPVIRWTATDARRITPVPADHWLLVEDSMPFRATLKISGAAATHRQSVPAGKKHVAAFAPRDILADGELILERYAGELKEIVATARFLPSVPPPSTIHYQPSTCVLFTNGRGGMGRMRMDLGRVDSKYDCVLGANLHPSVPVDRHVLVKRLRAWVNTDGFLSGLDMKNLSAFESGPPATWQFVANAGDGRTVEIQLRAEMLDQKNTMVFQFSRPAEKHASGKQLPADADVRLTVRADIEDRNFHWETKRNDGADLHFSSNTRALDGQAGFAFTPAADRQLRVFCDSGAYHPEPEWCENIPHPVEAGRGQSGSGDAYSPGWFEIPLPKGATVTLVITAETETFAAVETFNLKPDTRVSGDIFGERLLHAARQFVVRRDSGKTVIAGYPWFLDWGRDTLICCRGLLAGGLADDVKQLLLTFARFEQDGTLPNAIYGDNASNRDTSDAPLWFAAACNDLGDPHFFNTPVSANRTIRNVLQSIGENYIRGTPNGIHMDNDSALVWSPSHFTWMDTNYPACTPREGYPVEIQALWINLLRLLGTISVPAEQPRWRTLAERAMASFDKLFWLEHKGWFADVLPAKSPVRARDAVAGDALRNNCLFAISLGIIRGDRAKRCVAAAQQYLVVPGALRTLAPAPVSVPMPVYGNDGRLLNDPSSPYWPRYEGDEDTRRKPAYHNGTAWTWTFPVFCEALARAWDFSPAAVAAAKSYLMSAGRLLDEGCLGQLPEILDGDAPHTQRGCDAQAWGATEWLRVWKLLNSPAVQAK